MLQNLTGSGVQKFCDCDSNDAQVPRWLCPAFPYLYLRPGRAWVLPESLGPGLADVWVGRAEGRFKNAGPADVCLGCTHSEFG